MEFSIVYAGAMLGSARTSLARVDIRRGEPFDACELVDVLDEVAFGRLR